MTVALFAAGGGGGGWLARIHDCKHVLAVVLCTVVRPRKDGCSSKGTPIRLEKVTYLEQIMYRSPTDDSQCMI